MKFKALVTVNSILALVSGAACVLVPAQLLAHYEVSLSPMGIVIYQFWGATLVGLGLLIWFARTITDRLPQRKISLALFVTNALSCVTAFRGQYAGANARGWSMVILFGLFALAYGAFTLMKPQNTVSNDGRPA
jgi:hypothetical protein